MLHQNHVDVMSRSHLAKMADFLFAKLSHFAFSAHVNLESFFCGNGGYTQELSLGTLLLQSQMSQTFPFA